MKKVIVIGCPGSGKTTFAEKLNKLTEIPLFYLDAIWHKPYKTHISREEYDECCAKYCGLIRGSSTETTIEPSKCGFRRVTPFFCLIYRQKSVLRVLRQGLAKRGMIFRGLTRSLIRSSKRKSKIFRIRSCRVFMLCSINTERTER